MTQFFEDMEVGQRRELGDYTFTPESIVTFAKKFDPQPFHLDEEAGKNSLFGGLAASGWHVGSACMSVLVASGKQLAQEMAARGEEVAVWGPSPGFRELQWIKPVLAGDTLTFATEVVSKRVSSSRPGWGLIEARNTGTNQRGELAYSVLTAAFLPLKAGRGEGAESAKAAKGTKSETT